MRSNNYFSQFWKRDVKNGFSLVTTEDIQRFWSFLKRRKEEIVNEFPNIYGLRGTLYISTVSEQDDKDNNSNNDLNNSNKQVSYECDCYCRIPLTNFDPSEFRLPTIIRNIGQIKLHIGLGGCKAAASPKWSHNRSGANIFERRRHRNRNNSGTKCLGDGKTRATGECEHSRDWNRFVNEWPYYKVQFRICHSRKYITLMQKNEEHDERNNQYKNNNNNNENEDNNIRSNSNNGNSNGNSNENDNNERQVCYLTMKDFHKHVEFHKFMSYVQNQLYETVIVALRRQKSLIQVVITASYNLKDYCTNDT